VPKGDQISQNEIPEGQGGTVESFVNKGEKSVRLTRAHLEEDAGKSLHESFNNMTGIDLNRAGTPLLEIVTEPELRGAKEAVAYAQKLHALVMWIGICDGNMQEGSFRCDANVSVRKEGDTKLGTRCEIKNLNSFRFMEQAIEFEAKRQIEIMEDGGKIDQETRLYDPDRNETRSMRSKEDAQDYRYFPDPDLLPLVITQEMISDVRKTMPELPEITRTRFAEYGFPEDMVNVLVSDRDKAQDFDKFWRTLLEKTEGCDKMQRVQAANWAMMEVAGAVKDLGLPVWKLPISPEGRAPWVARLIEGSLSPKMAKEVFGAMLVGEG
jgi:aspartyl-tRNA(Asn)/glutamyl-tRNA(Gln) amidotransferase subunit B